METLVRVSLELIVIVSPLLLVAWVVKCSLRWSYADRRAGELLRAVLTYEQYCQLSQRGYIDIPSPGYPQRVYRVPQARGLVRVIENERLKVSLCLQPLDWVPDADIVVMHKLMIEADEESYLQKANRIVPLNVSRIFMWRGSVAE